MNIEFAQGTYDEIQITITVNGETEDISADTVSFILKNNIDDIDANAVMLKDATLTDGADGIALFVFTSSQLSIALGRYYYEIYWTEGTKVRLVEQGALDITDRVKDVAVN